MILKISTRIPIVAGCNLKAWLGWCFCYLSQAQEKTLYINSMQESPTCANALQVRASTTHLIECFSLHLKNITLQQLNVQTFRSRCWSLTAFVQMHFNGRASSGCIDMVGLEISSSGTASISHTLMTHGWFFDVPHQSLWSTFTSFFKDFQMGPKPPVDTLVNFVN